MDPTNKLKANLITIPRKIKRDTGMGEKLYNTKYPQVVLLQSSMVCPKFTKQAPPLDLLYQAGAQSLSEVLKSLPRYLGHW